MARTVLGYRLTTKFSAPPIRAKRRTSKKKLAAKKNPNMGRQPKYPFHAMAVGESFFITGLARDKISAAAAHHRSMSFATREVAHRGVEGVRVWRVQ